MYIYKIIFIFIFSFFLSGCTKTPTTPVVETSPMSIFEDTYNDAVDHTKKGKKIHEITITPHIEKVQFFKNGAETEIWSYGTGLDPLVIRAKKDDVLSVTLKNEIPEATTLHRHGVRVPHKEDGVPGMTQSEVQPGETYKYTVPLRDAGTYRFHTHTSTMEPIGRGLYGIIIVEDEKLPVFDTERLWALKDYRLDEQGRLKEQFGTMGMKTHAGYLGNVMTISNIPSPTFKVTPGEKVLIRLVNTSNARFYNLDFSDWDVEVVESDGGRIKSPYKPTILQLGVGERYTLLWHVPKDFNTTKILRDRYYDRRPNQMLAVAKKQLDEKTSGVVSMNTKSKITYDENLPDWRVLRGKEPAHTIHLGGMGVMGGDKRRGPNGERGWTINNQIRPHTNSLMTLKKGEMTIVRLQNDSTRDHPMHLHGDFFQVVGVNGKKRPYAGWKDTVNVPAKGYLDLAIIPTNIGKWMFHCHINEHAEFGMMATVEVVE